MALPLVDTLDAFFLAKYKSERLAIKKRNASFLGCLCLMTLIAGVIGVLIPIPFVQVVLGATVALGIILIVAVKAGKADLANIVTTTFPSIMLASLCFLQPFKEGNEISSCFNPRAREGRDQTQN